MLYWKNGAILSRKKGTEFIFIQLLNDITVRFSVCGSQGPPVDTGNVSIVTIK